MTYEEINQYIHEKLFDECWHKYEIKWFGLYCPKCKSNSIELVRPEYCNNISDAWKVVEKMQEKVCNFYIERRIADNPNDDYLVEFGGHFVFDDSAPKAICLAAIEALKENE
jgi:hypothetical protein